MTIREALKAAVAAAEEIGTVRLSPELTPGGGLCVMVQGADDREPWVFARIYLTITSIHRIEWCDRPQDRVAGLLGTNVLP